MVDYTYDVDGNPVRRVQDCYEDAFCDYEDLVNPFVLKGDGFDVTLSMARGMLSWTSVSPKVKKSKFPMPGTATLSKGTVDLPLKDIYGVTIKRKRAKGQLEGEGLCQGFSVYTYYEFGPNCWRDLTLDFEHPSESLCNKYYDRISEFIKDFPGRPHSLKFFMQTHAGGRTGSQLYRNKILPMLKAANLSVDFLEIQHSEHVKQEMVHINIDDYDCMVAMGGDGTASKVVSGLLMATQNRNEVEIRQGFTPVRPTMPVGIIPTGTTNQIARSVIGLADPITAVLYILLGYSVPVDVCSIFSDDKLIQWNFACQYGFGANALRYANNFRNNLLPKSIDASIFKAASKKKLKPYDCDIEYIPSENPPKHEPPTVCYRGCNVCWTEEVKEEEQEECIVQPFNALNTSNNSDTFVDLSKDESPWKVCKGSFLQVGLFCIPARSEIAPEGLHKFSHLNDGNMELVLVKNTNRKDFVRFLKRHGNSKNQFDFPFVDVIRVKEVKFRPRLPTGWKHTDRQFHEIQYRMSKVQRERSKGSQILEIDDVDDKSDVGEFGSPLDDMSDEEEEEEEEDDTKDSSLSGSRKSSADSNRSSEPKQYINNNNVIVNSAHQDRVLIGPQYRMTFADIDRMKRKNKQIKKEDKAKAREERQLRTKWNLDNELINKHELDFRVHHGLISLYGRGVTPNSVFQEYGCLPIAR
ncbi:ceramide kinase-like protein [Ostrea edulis]|uniref:ceramide kinase-like protein n=1 Tax=Ostrea edulis TaxID=37623 RepID=UPI0024AED065|nr:ceramide kinase-like protein [Ostrea edulis]